MCKIASIILCALLSVSAWSASVDDLVAIRKSWTFIADEYTANGTVAFTKNTLYAGDRIFTPTGNTVATNKGNSTIAGEEHLNCLRLKNVQDRLAFKVTDTCTITFYSMSHSSRGIIVSKSDRASTDDPYYAQQPASTTVWTIHLDEAGTYFLSSYGGDFYFAGFSVILPDDGSEPEKPVVKYFDTNGTLLGRDTVTEGSLLTYKYTEADVTIPEGQSFRGWRGGDGMKVAEGTPVLADLSLYAKATEIEVAAVGNYFYYDMTKGNFYPDDHELLTVTDGNFYNNHGWSFNQGGTIAVEVAGNAVVSLIRCQYGNGGTITCQDALGNTVGETLDVKGSTDGEPAVFRYEGAATTLTFTLANGGYIHGLKVYNVEAIPVQNEAGYYVIAANDGAGLLLMLDVAANGNKIFLPDGIYDLGTATMTSVSAGISLIGQSMEGVVIVNHPLTSGMNTAETLVLRADNIYLQDLAVRCDVSYPNSTASGVGIAVQVKGDKSIFKHVSLQGNQDTYYSSGTAAQRSWFGDGRIEGTVDYICGGGNMWFENVQLYNNDRSNADVIVAPATDAASMYGYVFNNCTIDGAEGQDGRWNLGRGWKNSPAATWLNTTCLITPSEQGYTHMSAGLVCRFHEYNTHLEDGTAITGHNLDNLGYDANSDAIYLENTGIYTYENVVLGDDNWDAAAIAAQVTADPQAIDADAAYLVEDEGTYVEIIKGSQLSADYNGKTIRQANSRGGFGEAVEYIAPTALESVSNQPSTAGVQKVLCDGQLIIISDATEYNAIGQKQQIR